MNLRTAYAILRPKASSAVAVMPLMVFRAAAGGLPIAIGLYIAHRWGLHELAAFTVANALIAVALVVTDWGCSRSLPREIAVKERDESGRFVARANGVRILLAGAIVVVSVAASISNLIDRDVVSYLFLLLPLCLIAIVSTNAVSARVVSGEVAGIGFSVVAGVIVFLASAALIGYGKFAGGRGLVVAYVIGKCVESVVLLMGRAWVLRTAFAGVRDALSSLWPFSIQAILGVIYSRLVAPSSWRRGG